MINKMNNYKYPIYLGCCITTLDNDQLSIETVNGKYKVKGAGIYDILKTVDKMDGQLSLDNYIKNEEDYKLFQKLEIMGIVKLNDKSIDENLYETYSYITRYANNPLDVIERIKNVKILIYENECFNINLKDELRESGFKNVTYTNDEKFDPTDIDILITITKNDVKYLNKVNSLILDKVVKWIPVVISRKEIEIGPIVYPRESSCYKCHLILNVEKTNYTKDFIDRECSYLIPPVKSQLRGLLSTMVMEIVGEYKKSTLWGKSITLGVDKIYTSTNEVLKSSLCTCYCDINKPRLKRWEYEV